MATKVHFYSKQRQARALDMTNTLSRGLFHLFGVLIIPIAALFLPRLVLLISLGSVTFLVSILEFVRLKFPGVNRWFILIFKPLLRDEENSRLTGTVYSLAGALISFLIFPRDIAIMTVAFLAVGDPIATIIGKHFGKTRFLGKSLEGNLACFLACLIVGFIGYSVGLEVGLLALLLGAFGAAVAEALPLPLNDNLSLPLVAGLVMLVVPF